MAHILDHATGHYLPVAAGCVCGQRGGDHFGAAALLPVLLVRAAGRRLFGADLPGLDGKPCVLAIDRANWDFGKAVPAKARINILMISVEWHGVGVPLIWTLLASAGNSDTKTRTFLLDRVRQTFPDIKIASLTGDREFIGDV